MTSPANIRLSNIHDDDYAWLRLLVLDFEDSVIDFAYVPVAARLEVLRERRRELVRAIAARMEAKK